MTEISQHGWPQPSPADGPGDDPQAELAHLLEQLAQLVDGGAGASELWRVVQRIREVRAQL